MTGRLLREAMAGFFILNLLIL